MVKSGIHYSIVNASSCEECDNAGTYEIFERILCKEHLMAYIESLLYELNEDLIILQKT